MTYVMLISSCLVHSIDAICLTNAPVNPGTILSNHITKFNGIYPYAYPMCSTSMHNLHKLTSNDIKCQYSTKKNILKSYHMRMCCLY